MFLAPSTGIIVMSAQAECCGGWGAAAQVSTLVGHTRLSTHMAFPLNKLCFDVPVLLLFTPLRRSHHSHHIYSARFSSGELCLTPPHGWKFTASMGFLKNTKEKSFHVNAEKKAIPFPRPD